MTVAKTDGGVVDANSILDIPPVVVDEYRGQPVRWIQPKLDGYRVRVRINDAGHVNCLSKTGAEDYAEALLTLPTIGPRLRDLPRLTLMDCEMHAPGAPATDVLPMLLAGDARLQLSPFCLMVLGGVDLRGRNPVEAAATLRERGWPVVVTERAHPHSNLPTRPLSEEYLDSLRREAALHKLEGYVAKTDYHTGWYKIKPVRTCDLVVIGVTTSASRSFSGMVAALRCAPFGRDELCKVSAGLTPADRSQDRDTLVGRVVEIAHDGPTKHGRLRNPRLLRWRDDKSPTQCDGRELVAGGVS
jgi:ATP-dependent DNA ligase